MILPLLRRLAPTTGAQLAGDVLMAQGDLGGASTLYKAKQDVISLPSTAAAQVSF